MELVERRFISIPKHCDEEKVGMHGQAALKIKNNIEIATLS